MRIESLQLQGFKSFREEVFLTFPGGITAIVGPNGSGKSNIADAFRWVLGEQSLKTIRSRESTDVIFSGSSSQPKLSRAEVSVAFAMDQEEKPRNTVCLTGREENEEETDDVVGKIIASGESHIEIARKVYASGESSYQINRNLARLLDVQLFLAHKNVGACNYAVIGQGMIDEVLKLSPKDRLDFFYEATGVKKYQIKLHKAQLKLAVSRERLRETSALLSEIAPHKKYLARQAEKYVRRKEIIESLHKKQEIYYAQTLFEVQNALLEKRADFVQIELQYRNKEQEMQARELEINEMKRVESGVFVAREADAALLALQRERERIMHKIAEISREEELNLETVGRYDAAFMHRRLAEVREHIDDGNQERIECARFAMAVSDQLSKKTREIGTIRERLNALKRDTSHQGICQTLRELLVIVDIREICARIQQLIDSLNEEQIGTSPVGVRGTALAEQEQLMLEVKAEIDDLRVQERVLTEKERLNKLLLERLIEERADLDLKLAHHEHGASGDVVRAIKERLAGYRAKKSELDIEEARLLERKEELRRAEEKKREALFQWQKNYAAVAEEKNHITGLLQAVKIELARLEMRREQLGMEAREEMGEERARKVIEAAQAENRKTEPRSPDATRSLRREIKQLGAEAASLGEVDDEVLREYEEVKKRFDFLSGQTNDLDGAITTLTKICKNLERKITKQFGEKFGDLNRAFGKFVNMIFQGGRGVLKEIKLDGSDEIGIEIIAEPPGKKIKHTGVLSGGERSLVAVALLCAIISSNPPPFVILDEIDAALDEANASRLTEIVRELSAHTQFIIITHNRATMEIADVLYGVTMGVDGVSRLVGVKLEEYA